MKYGLDCFFCRIPKDKIVAQNEYALVKRDFFPVTEGHTLFIPKRHVADYFDLTSEELSAIQSLIIEQKEFLQSNDDTITGFNIGVNIGEDAGQTVFHVHVHLIPRRKGDMENPRGGVRGVIPEKQKY